MKIETSGRYGGTNYTLEAASQPGMYRVLVAGRVIGRVTRRGDRWFWHYSATPATPAKAADGHCPDYSWAADEVVKAHLAARGQEVDAAVPTREEVDQARFRALFTGGGR